MTPPKRLSTACLPLKRILSVLCALALIDGAGIASSPHSPSQQETTATASADGQYWNKLARRIDQDAIGCMNRFDDAQLPPVRWQGDGMDSVFGPAEYDDLKIQYQTDSVSFRRVWDLPLAVAAYEKRFSEEYTEQAGTQRIPMLKFQWCRIEQFNFAAGGGRKSVGCLLNFYQCEFLDDAYFHSVTFKNGIGFCGSSFKKYVGFRRAEFPAGLYFFDTRFEGEVNLGGATIAGPFSLRDSRFAESLDLRWANLRNMTWMEIAGLRIAGRTALAGDLKMHLSQLKGRVLGESLTEPPFQPVMHALPSEGLLEGAERLLHAAEQYSVLAGNFSAGNEPMAWTTADWCHSRSWDLRRKAAWVKGAYLAWVKMALWKVLFGNGVDWEYPAGCALVIIAGCALLYHWRSCDIRLSPPSVLNTSQDNAAVEVGVAVLADVQGRIRRLLTALYFSAVTFSTIGYGDWRPVRCARAIAALEGLSGPLVMAAFVVIMIRKIIR